MSERKLFVCSQCHEFWSSTQRATTCAQCGGPVCPVEQDYEEYASWTPEEKKAFKEQYVATHNLKATTSTYQEVVATATERTQTAQDSEFWIGCLNMSLNVALVCFVLLAIVALFSIASLGGANVLTGIVSAVVIVVVGILSVAGMKIFIGMAKDLKAIRKKLDA